MNKYENVMVNMMIKMHFSLPINDAQDKREISAQVGRTICSGVSLLKWIISPHNLKWRYTYNAHQWQILEQVLSLMVFFH